MLHHDLHETQHDQAADGESGVRARHEQLMRQLEAGG
jgi:F0F1-type ATP synthase epsilon subunit